MHGALTDITVALGDRSYPIRIGTGALAALPDMLRATGARGVCAVVSDSNVAPLYAERVARPVEEAGLRATTCVLPAGEQHKRLARIDELCGQFLEAGMDRAGLVVALGGGVVGDVAGYAAASYMRGVPCVQVPTSIVAQVDSSVGGKTGVNHALAKNIIGAFHQPSGVCIDLTLLETLPERELRAGLAEVIKHGIIADAALFDYVTAHAGALLAKELDAFVVPVRRSCEIKAAVVAEDEREHGLRAILNYGHTFGHAIEAVSRYETFLHGEAIALGMVCAGAMARDLGLVDAAFEDRQRACIEACGLPTAWPDVPVDEAVAAMRRDKKARAGALRFILADRIGHVVQRTDITEEQARRAFAALRP
jgi:3-dehydroquinate synthase